MSKNEPKHDVSSKGDGVPCVFSGIVNTITGKHAVKDEFTDKDGNKYTGYGHTRQEAIDDATSQASRK